MNIFNTLVEQLKGDRQRSGEIEDFYLPTHNEILKEEFHRNREIVDEEDMYYLSLLDSEKAEEERF